MSQDSPKIYVAGHQGNVGSAHVALEDGICRVYDDFQQSLNLGQA